MPAPDYPTPEELDALPDGVRRLIWEQQEALEVAAFELNRCHGLVVADGAAPALTFTINTLPALERIEPVLDRLPTVTIESREGWPRHPVRRISPGER
jgi:hypothetical protein